MILNDVKMIGTNEPVNIRINGEKIVEISSSVISDKSVTSQITFDKSIVFPGLINSHDHLDFNLFPQLGTETYSNYTEWGNHIHKRYKEEIDQVLKIPITLRSRWGLFKNLLCGVTTVINHGEPSCMKNDLITVFEKSHCLHSVQFEKNWKIKLNNPLKRGLPAAIHVGEGNDNLAYKEIDELIQWNWLKKKLIGIHAVAMSEKQAKNFKAIVWCPQSNYFLLNKTAPINLLKKHTNILFGTDSTLTSSWDIWEHLRLARKDHLLTDIALYNTLNLNAADCWKLNSGEIAVGKDADLVVAKTTSDKTGLEDFFEIKPADILLITHRGNIRLFDESLLGELKAIELNRFSKIEIDGACKYVEGDLPGLMETIRNYHSAAVFPISVN
ncbi:MAG TPA: amidohydrolase family protein [Mucilaginibacter sp.]|jgi:cytosine/adenosine deaminase-related metal-dependent hydrolase